MDPLTPLETLCRIILRAREYEAQTPTDYDGNETADNVDDEEEGTLSVLDDAINDSVEEELKAVFEDLGEDQLAEVVAFCWVGQGTYDASDWDEAIEEANDLTSDGSDARDRRADGHADACVRARSRARCIRAQLRRHRRHELARGTETSSASPTDRPGSGASPIPVILTGRSANPFPSARIDAFASRGGTLFWIVT